MGKKSRRAAARAEPPKKRSVAILNGGWADVECLGYTRLDHNPEVVAAVDTIARLIASMTIHLMENTGNGDIRVKNELSRKIDINPFSKTTRFTFMHWLAKTMMLEGNAVVWPETSGGILRDLKPMPPGLVSFVPEGIWDYRVVLAGEEFDPDSVLHFVLNPDTYYMWLGTGYKVSLRDVVGNLKQAASTEKGFMSSNWKPSIIVKVDGMIDEFSGPEGRRKLLDDYISTTEAGEPWVIPSDQFEIEKITPLSLSDLAMADFVEIDKKTVASILGVPPFVVGVGDFKRDEWNNFINSRLMPIALIITQEMTKKLLYNPNWFFRFNPRSLYNYDIRDMAAVGDDQYIRGIMTGNEVRDWLGLPPLEGLDELVILENYIPRGMIGDQNKLNGGDSG